MSTQPLNNQPLNNQPRRWTFKPVHAPEQGPPHRNILISGLSVLATIVVIIPLIAILFYLVYKGASSPTSPLHPRPGSCRRASGGMANAIVGSASSWRSLASWHSYRIAAASTSRSSVRGKAFATAVRFTADVLMRSLHRDGISVFTLS